MNPKAVNLYNKALELIKLDRLAQAKRNLEKSLKLQPNFFQAHTSLGNVFETEGLHVKALEHYQKANQILPNNPIILTNIGNALSKSGNNIESLSFYNAAISADSNYSTALINSLTLKIKLNQVSNAYDLVLSKTGNNVLFLVLASIFLQLVKDKELSDYKDIKAKALELAKTIKINASYRQDLISTISQANLGLCIFHNLLGFLIIQYEDHYAKFADFILDISSYLPACSASSHYFYSLQQLRSGNFDQALLHINQSISEGCSESMASAIIDILFALNRPDEAFEQLIKLEQNVYPTPVTASLFFRHGDFIKGWNQYSRTENTFNHISIIAPKPEDINCKSILILSGQGIGDIIMFLSCMRDFIRSFSPKSITLNCDTRLHSLIKRSFKNILTIYDEKLSDPRFIGHSFNKLSSYDSCIKLSSICALTRKSLNNFYPNSKYFLPATDLYQHYDEKLKKLPFPISIGLAWRGGVLKNSFNKKNISLNDFLPLLTIPGINWISLQYGNVADEITSFNEVHGTKLIHFNEIDPLKEIETQFALISNLDLVIQTSNTSIHFAGSQGIPTWVMISEPSDFRWFEGKDKGMSPWYENMRVCRKAPELQWSDYIANLAKELQVKLDSLK